MHKTIYCKKLFTVKKRFSLIIDFQFNRSILYVLFLCTFAHLRIISRINSNIFECAYKQQKNTFLLYQLDGNTDLQHILYRFDNHNQDFSLSRNQTQSINSILLLIRTHRMTAVSLTLSLPASLLPFLPLSPLYSSLHCLCFSHRSSKHWSV